MSLLTSPGNSTAVEETEARNKEWLGLSPRPLLPCTSYLEGLLHRGRLHTNILPQFFSYSEFKSPGALWFPQIHFLIRHPGHGASLTTQSPSSRFPALPSWGRNTWAVSFQMSICRFKFRCWNVSAAKAAFGGWSCSVILTLGFHYTFRYNSGHAIWLRILKGFWLLFLKSSQMLMTHTTHTHLRHSHIPRSFHMLDSILFFSAWPCN